jgi:predicted phosphohydrolase
MRVVITADLHYRPSQREVFIAFARQIAAQEPDCFILAGDIGHPLRLFCRALQLFADLPCPKLLIAGNHDLYRGEFDSRTLWEKELPHAAREEGFIWLENQPLTLPLPSARTLLLPADQAPLVAHRHSHQLAERGMADRTDAQGSLAGSAGYLGICGSLAWYDYSSRDPHLAYSNVDYRSMKHLVNHDADYIDWPWSDRAVARYLARGLAVQLAKLQADVCVRQILVVTHMPIFEPAIPRHPSDEFWSLLAAYLGNLTIGELVRRQPKVTHVVSGHVHRPGQWIIPGDHGPIDVRLVGSQKGIPRSVTLDFPTNVGW